MEIKKTLQNAEHSINDMGESLQKNVKAFVWYTVAAFLLMGITAVAVFFFANKGYEQVLVPDVTGKSLPRALLEMQERELYPRLQLRYSDLPGEVLQVLSQSPKAGSVVKAGGRVTLVVSRGVIIDHVENYVGTNIDAVKTKFDTLYGGVEIPPITIAPPVFKADASEIGTILEQSPAAGTPITQGVVLTFIVSSGNTKPVVKVPDFKGHTIARVLDEMGRLNLLFDFTSHIAGDGETPGTVVSQSVAVDSDAPEYSSIALDIALDTPGEGTRPELSRGIFSAETARYPIAVPVKLDALPPDGTLYTVASFNHLGGKITVPYSVPHGSTLVLSVVNQEMERITVQ